MDAYGARLVADHKIAFLQVVRCLEEEELSLSGLAKAEAKRFISAATKLGATLRISGAVVSASDVLVTAVRRERCGASFARRRALSTRGIVLLRPRGPL